MEQGGRVSPSGHDQERIHFDTLGVDSVTARSQNREQGLQEGRATERIRCRKWSAVGGRRRSRGKWSTRPGNTPRKRIRNKRSNIDSLIGDRGGIVGDENVGGIGKGGGTQRHSRCPASICLKPIRQRVAD